MAVRAEKGMVRVVARVARAPTGVSRAQLMSEAVIDLFFPSIRQIRGCIIVFFLALNSPSALGLLALELKMSNHDCSCVVIDADCPDLLCVGF